MGTSWSLSAVSPPSGAMEDVQAVLDRVVAQMSQWERNSDLSRFNSAPEGSWRALPPEFVRVLKSALELSHLTGGAFDPGLGQASELWGFGASAAPAAAPGHAETNTLSGCGHIELDAPGLRARRTGQVQLDLSAIAKGFGVDLAAEWLLSQGLRHFLIEVGGELRAHGLKPDGQPWWVDIECPPASPIAPLRVALHELSVATSGDYRRWLDADGKRYGHTFDPRTGRPVENGVRSVTVLHPSCMLADGWATALSVLGPDEGLPLAEAQGLTAHMIVGETEHMTTALRAMLD